MIGWSKQESESHGQSLHYRGGSVLTPEQQEHQQSARLRREHYGDATLLTAGGTVVMP